MPFCLPWPDAPLSTAKEESGIGALHGNGNGNGRFPLHFYGILCPLVPTAAAALNNGKEKTNSRSPLPLPPCRPSPVAVLDRCETFTHR